MTGKELIKSKVYFTESKISADFKNYYSENTFTFLGKERNFFRGGNTAEEPEYIELKSSAVIFTELQKQREMINNKRGDASSAVLDCEAGLVSDYFFLLPSTS